MTALAATPDGGVVYAGSPDGLVRTADRRRPWTAMAYRGSAFAIATTADGQTVAVVGPRDRSLSVLGWRRHLARALMQRRGRAVEPTAC